jgi:hypothetical protein
VGKDHATVINRSVRDARTTYKLVIKTSAVISPKQWVTTVSSNTTSTELLVPKQ